MRRFNFKAAIVTFIPLAIVLNSPPILLQVPIVHIPAVILIAIWALPGIIFASIFPNDYKITDFGPSPETTFAWGCLMGFWIVVACIIAILVGFLVRRDEYPR